MKFKHLSLIALIAFSGCSKDKDEDPIVTPVDQTQTEKNILNDFAGILVNPNYADIQTKAGILEDRITILSTTQTDANLLAAQEAWREVRAPWEKCEGFLFGPVDDFSYDPEMDTWPLNVTDLDALIAGPNPLTTADIDSLPTSLKGFHAIEYILFGMGGTRLAADITPRQMTYLISLADNLHNVTTSLQTSWTTGGFTVEWTTSGSGSTRFTTREDAFLTLVGAMAGICEEVGEGKMQDPFIAQDSTLEESQFSHNSITDFKNNMISVQNAYLGKYSADGHGLNELVALKNASLDQKIQGEISAAINGFDQINSNYGWAIYNQQTQIIAQQERIQELKMTLEDELLPAIQQWITE